MKCKCMFYVDGIVIDKMKEVIEMACCGGKKGCKGKGGRKGK